MPCKVGRLGSSGFVIVCSRGHRTPPACRWCGKPSTKLCDYPTSKNGTCDAPICDAHAMKQGPNLDTCPDHPHMRYLR